MDTPVKIPLTRGMFALVDAADAPGLLKYNWYAEKGARGTWYAARKPKSGKVYMHQQIMGFPERPLEVDHWSKDGLDNRMSNLRLSTKSQNNANGFKPTAQTGFRGVAKNHDRFAAKIRCNGKWRYIGTFDTPEQAAHAYDAAAIEQWGDFATLNFPKP